VRLRLLLCSIFLLVFTNVMLAQQSPTDVVTDQATRWLKAISTGDRATLDPLTDPKFIATTPGGDVLTKDRLIPADADKPVQKLPPMELQGPIVRVYGDAAVLMSPLTSSGGPGMSATFVFTHQGSDWKLVALHLSPRK
jgi:Domain of unknown function (DUF4440)